MMKILKQPAKIRASFAGDNEKFLEFQKLFPIVPATTADRSWWKEMKAHFFVERLISKDGTTKQEKSNTMKYCPGVFDFSNCGYIVPCLNDMAFYVNRAQEITWQLPSWIPERWIDFQGKEQIDSCPISHGKNTGNGIIKVSTPWIWETPKGWSTIITKPFYNYSNDFDVCPGIIDSDLDNWSNHLINIFLRFNVIDKEILFRAGQPLCQLIPFERQNTKLTITEEPSKKTKKTIIKDLAAAQSRFSNNPETSGISLLEYRDPSTKKYK